MTASMQDRSGNGAPSAHSGGTGDDGIPAPLGGARAGHPDRNGAASPLAPQRFEPDAAGLQRTAERLEGENAVLRRSLDDALDIGNAVVAMGDELKRLSETVRQLQNRFMGEHGPSAKSSRLDALTEAVTRLRAKVERFPDLDGMAELLGRMADQQDNVHREALRASEGSNAAAEQLHLILTSRSWRLLRPVRGVGRLLKGLARR